MQAIGTNSRVVADIPLTGLESSAAKHYTDAGNAEEAGTHRLVPLFVWLAVILTLVFIPLKVISYGYLPPDDALRHAGKAVSGRDWSDILVVQDQFKMDHNPGWHSLLALVHKTTGMDADGLVVASVAGLLLLFSFFPLAWIRRPEAWIASLLAGTVIFPLLIHRMFLGRPFELTIAGTMGILLLWRDRKTYTPALLAGTTFIFAMSAWLHGSWYLSVLIMAAFGLAGHWQSSFRLAGCWVAGSFLGGLATGQPLAFLWNAVSIGINCFGQHQLNRMLVTEFSPSNGDFPALLFAALLIIFRVVAGSWTWNTVKNPAFMLAVLGWILGLSVVRFWTDWGLPALTLWAALELQDHLNRVLNAASVRRLGISLALCAAFYFSVTADTGGRWTRFLTVEHLTESDPEMDAWLPEDGGTFYCADMGLFYRTFFKNPHAKWKYILGFESTFMPPEDLRIYRNIQWNFYAHKAYQPWVEKMRPEDRLVISAGSSSAPAIPALEWKYVARETWIGRVPRKEQASVGELPVAAPAPTL